jgi:hypothetical protein
MQKITSSNFKRLIGVWITSGTVLQDGKTLTLEGTDSYEIVLDGWYILHKANVTMGDQKSETFELISLDETDGAAKMQYFNSKGESDLMSGHISNDDYFISGDRLKFSGTIGRDDSEIIGSWYLLTEGKQWKQFIEMKLTKQPGGSRQSFD